MTLKRISAIVTLALGALLLTSCAAEPAASAPSGSSSAPSTTASTPSETPTVDPLSTMNHIELNAETFTLWNGSTQLATLKLSDRAGTLAALSTALGTPATTSSQAQERHCIAAETMFDWNKSIRIIRPDDTDAGYAARLLTDRVQRQDGTSVSLTGTGGVKVGDDISPLIAQTAPALKDEWKLNGVTSYVVILQRGYLDQKLVTGVVAFTTGTIVNVIGTPVPVHSNQDC